MATVAELIAELEKFDPQSRVVMRDPEWDSLFVNVGGADGGWDEHEDKPTVVIF